MKKSIWIALFIIVAGAGYFFLRAKSSNALSGPEFIFTNIERGNLESVISSTGTLNPVNTVEVGTQVSGIINEIYVDFNDEVTKGQLVAKIDDTFLKASLNDAIANLERVKAQKDLARIDFERAELLYNDKVTTEQDYLTKKYNLDQAIANLKSSQSSYERALTNLSFTSIHSPINGIVISRNVSTGQTVASSMSAPTLFVIAEDLSKMEILADVDESDIGKIKKGQKIRFTVQAYDDEFEGEVRQVRLEPRTVENVVNYKVVIVVENQSGKLLPGMTTTVDFLIETAQDVFMVSNTALRFKVSDELLNRIEEARLAALPDSVRKIMEEMRRIQAVGGEIPDELRQQIRATRGSGGFGGRRPGVAGQGVVRSPGGFDAGSFQDRFATLYYLDSLGNPKSMRVIKGITNGQMTQIRGRQINAGMEIIRGYTNPLSASKNQSNSNDLFGTNNSRRRFPGGI
jgi:HlyD family secretion protein